MENHRCELSPFLLDLIDCALEQIELARTEDDRAAALDVAMSALAVARQRVWEDQAIGASLMLALDEWMFSAHAKDAWIELAQLPADQFGRAADDLIARLQSAKAIVTARAASSAE